MKIYKITLYTAALIFSILAILSILLNFWNENAWVSFTIDWCVGITCSAAVVVVTTFIQFKMEQRKTINELGSAIRMLLFQNKIGGYAFEEGAEQEMSARQIDFFQKKWKEEIEKGTDRIFEICSQFEAICPKNNHKFFVIQKNALLVRSSAITDENVDDIYLDAQQKIQDIAKTILQFGIMKYDKEEIEKYVKEHCEHR